MDAIRKFILTKSRSESQNCATASTWTSWTRYVACIAQFLVSSMKVSFPALLLMCRISMISEVWIICQYQIFMKIKITEDFMPMWIFTRESSYCFQRILAIAILSVRLSVCASFTRVGQSKAVQARITKSSPLAAWKTLVSGTVKLFHKFEGGHPERGR